MVVMPGKCQFPKKFLRAIALILRICRTAAIVPLKKLELFALRVKKNTIKEDFFQKSTD
jgi:type IV secretory pathway component VirB8